MRKMALSVFFVTVAFVLGRLSAQDIQPSCEMCPATYVSAEEIQRYADVGSQEGITDQQVRSIDIGRVNVQIAIAHRGKLDAPPPGSVAEHDLVTEVYYVLSGSGTNRTGPDLVDKRRRPSDNRAVQFLNGPGNNADDIRTPLTHELEAGDVFVIPAGTGHQFTKIDDHITYLMVRVDPDKVVPLMDEAASRAYLAEHGR
ncbi:MAG TPA: cupin domain-containing protein [Vicinamibacteria bacterium]|nr:cupin domain-containing protein [Vicinamibacteria bacterium]